MTADVQLLGISNAIVDVLAHVDDELIEKIGVVPGSMTLIDEARAHEIYEMMGPATEMSGGSVANTIAGFANLGGRAAYIGRVRNDQLGEIFNHDMRSLGVDIRLKPAPDGAPTARSHIMITADGQRTMNTYLGACTELGVADITPDTFGKPKAVLIEGYVWDIAEGPALARKAMELAAKNRAKVALSLSDSFCVERHKESYEEAIRSGVDIIVADEDEINVLMGTDSFDETLDAIGNFDNLFVMTRSEHGSVIFHRGELHVQQATPVEKVIDTTGAGDAYCAGFLYGWVHDRSLAECARAGTLCATAVIQQVGARIEKGVLD
ncbi:MAG: adenosine kinase [Gammaproteobacteria bacterium]|jgi:sugar/nucleoside kinase (ribokinase family)|nr:adenosine kinase [Gammaproteobacteria bacterium]